MSRLVHEADSISRELVCNRVQGPGHGLWIAARDVIGQRLAVQLTATLTQLIGELISAPE